MKEIFKIAKEHLKDNRGEVSLLQILIMAAIAFIVLAIVVTVWIEKGINPGYKQAVKDTALDYLG